MTRTVAAAGVAPVAAISVSGVTVRFGDLTALDDVSMAFESGRIHALVGQNGAGKTTLAKVAMGLALPEAGSVEVHGRQMPLGEVSAARAAGVEMVHQSFILPPSFTVAEALEMFNPSVGRGFGYQRASLERRWGRILDEAALEISPRSRIRDLPVESLQAVEIVRALARNARVLILDEPTAVLAPPAVDRLFERLRTIRDSGVTIVIVLHKVAEVLQIAETVGVLRAGRVALSPTPTRDLDAERLSDLIIGSADPAAAELEAARIEASIDLAAAVADVVLDEPMAASPAGSGSEVLRLEAVETRPVADEAPLRGVSLAIRGGEILGIAGVEGNGQRSLVGAVVGLQPVVHGSIVLEGHEVTARDARSRRRLGLRVVPFDRNAEGVSATSPIWENVAVREILAHDLRRGPLIDVAQLRETALRALRDWHVVFGRIDQRAGELSGGNVQRLIFARELGGAVRLMVAAQPTRGLDVAATAFVHETLRGLRASGAAVLLVSSDLEELFALSDRLVVLLGGDVVAEFVRPFDLRRVGSAMVGAVA